MKKALVAALLALGAVAVFIIAQHGVRAGQSEARLVDGNRRGDWASYGGAFGEQHYSPAAQINVSNVQTLGLAWHIDLPIGNSLAEPLEIDGVLYYTTNYSIVSAVDARTGEPRWTYDSETVSRAGHKLRTGWGARGLAWWNGKIYVGTQDGRLIAIDAATGAEVWSQMTVSPDDWNYITGAPRAFDGKVIIGFGGADFGPARGYVSTYDAETGELLWRWYTVPGNPAVAQDETTRIAASSWAGDWWELGGGGTVWNAMTYDPETDTVFLGTGNGSPWNWRVRSAGRGDNLFLCSIVALDAKTGAYKWHYQVNPGESWDYNAAMDMPLATLMIDGRPRKVIMQAPKNGFLYVIDRLTGELLSAEPFAEVTWASHIDLETGRPVEREGARYPPGSRFEMQPSPVGAHGWYPMAFSPNTRLVYIPVIEKSAVFSELDPQAGSWRRWSPPGAGQIAAMLEFPPLSDPSQNTSRLDAWDPTTQTRAWSRPTAGNQSGGVVATGGNLVFQGQLDGRFNAYSATTGELLWSFDAKAPVLAPPITYMAAGRQYVTVQTGMGAAGAMYGAELRRFNIDYRTQARRILTFALGGETALPPRREVHLQPVEDPDYRPNTGAEGRGAILFATRCVVCHGMEAVSGGAAPDLRVSSMPLSLEAFKDVVSDGAMELQGMPRYAELTSAELDYLRQYIRSRAAEMRTRTRSAASLH